MKAWKTSLELYKLKGADSVRKFQTAANKKQAQVATAESFEKKDSVSDEYALARPFDSIPGPKPLPIPGYGNLWRFMPFGTYGKQDVVEVHQRLYDEYGPIVRVSGVGALSQVILFDPEDVEKMFRNESMWPHRIAMASLKYYRSVTRKDFYQDQQGLVTSEGEDWRKFRMATNPAMMQPRTAKMYLKPVVDITDDFLERIRYIRDSKDEMPDDFIHEINKYSLENFGYITLEIRLGCLKNDLSPDSDAIKMINNTKMTLALMHELDFKPSLWKFYPTRQWKQFVKCMDESLEFSMKHIMPKWEAIKNQKVEKDKSERSVLENLLMETKDPRIPIVMVSDTLFAGIDTTSNTVATVLYLLSQNPDKQEILYQNLKKLLPHKNSPITLEVFNELKYTRAAIKESMRMHPTALGNQRTSVKDLVLRNYQVPKGTILSSGHTIMCRMDKHYKQVAKFIPERWLKDEVNSELSTKHTNPFVFLPFGFGQRSCVGRRFAELEMDVVVSKLVRNFKISYEYEPMTWTTRLVSTPAKPLKFKMVERPE